MPNPHCRIRKIVLKGGARLSMFISRRQSASEELSATLTQRTRDHVDHRRDMAGFFLITWGLDKTVSYSWSVTQDSPYQMETLDQVVSCATLRAKAD